jgi:hypothetical protein
VKKSAYYKTIDGYDIVTAIQEAVIDPAATTEAAEPLIGALPETAQANAIILKIQAQQAAMRDEDAKAAAKKQADPNADTSAEEARWNQAKANVQVEEQNLRAVLEAIEAAKPGLYGNAGVYFPPREGEKHLNPAEEAGLTDKWAALQKHEALTLTGEIIPDWRSTEYHIKTGGVWVKTKVEHIGEDLPEGAILPDDLTAEQRAEIAEQQEAERVAGLTPEQKAAEKQARLDAAADEADKLSRRAAIQGTDFDTAAWYAERQDEIEEKYA